MHFSNPVIEIYHLYCFCDFTRSYVRLVTQSHRHVVMLSLFHVIPI